MRGRLFGRLEANSLRVRLLVISAIAMAPIVIFASSLALQHAADAGGPIGVIGWLTASILPLLFGLAGCSVIAVAAEAWVLRWLLYFERVARAYARGRYSVRPQGAQRAPAEFRALAASVGDMAAAIEERDQAVRQALEQQTMVLREVHHRVKNNLQIVGSLLSLQASRAPDPATRAALTDALVRVDVMALGQRFLHDDGDISTVGASELFQAWASQIRTRLSQGPRPLDLVTEFDDQPLSLDIASPLALIATEALMQAYHRPGQAPLHCEVRLALLPDDVVLSLRVPDDPQAFQHETGVSAALIQGYARQIRGRVDLTDGLLAVRGPRTPRSPNRAEAA